LRHRPQWKRFTIDVPVELHRRIKTACASRDLEMATWMRKLLETNVARLENSPK
jgi:predicted HicB family RNase H-like nuclease